MSPLKAYVPHPLYTLSNNLDAFDVYFRSTFLLNPTPTHSTDNKILHRMFHFLYTEWNSHSVCTKKLLLSFLIFSHFSSFLRKRSQKHTRNTSLLNKFAVLCKCPGFAWMSLFNENKHVKFPVFYVYKNVDGKKVPVCDDGSRSVLRALSVAERLFLYFECLCVLS